MMCGVSTDKREHESLHIQCIHTQIQLNLHIHKHILKIFHLLSTISFYASFAERRKKKRKTKQTKN